MPRCAQNPSQSPLSDTHSAYQFTTKADAGGLREHRLCEVLSYWSVHLRGDREGLPPTFIAVIKTFPEQGDAYGHELFPMGEEGREVQVIGCALSHLLGFLTPNPTTDLVFLLHSVEQLRHVIGLTEGVPRPGQPTCWWATVKIARATIFRAMQF